MQNCDVIIFEQIFAQYAFWAGASAPPGLDSLDTSLREQMSQHVHLQRAFAKPVANKAASRGREDEVTSRQSDDAELVSTNALVHNDVGPA